MIHMFFIVRGGCRDVKRKMKNKRYLKRYKIWFASLSEEDKEKHDDPDEIEGQMEDGKEEAEVLIRKN